MKRPENLRLLPMFLLVAGLAFTVRVGEFVTGVSNMGAAIAQEEVKAEPPPMNARTTEHADAAESVPEPEIEGNLDLNAEGNEIKVKKEVAEKEAAPAPLPDPAAIADKPSEAVTWKDAGDEEINNSEVRDELYKDLAKRREALEKREKEMAVREALLSAAERELDQKVRELSTIRTEIEAAMKKQSDEENARITSLVKIYEGMKPKDAASIFNTLDLDVLIVIMQRMSERKSSAIISEMNPDRARTITIMMAEQKNLPGLSDSN